MEWILTWLWQGMAVAFVAAVGLRLAGWLNAATRYRVLSAALVAVLLLAPASLGLQLQTEGGRPGSPAVPSWLVLTLCGIWVGYAGLAGRGRSSGVGTCPADQTAIDGPMSEHRAPAPALPVCPP